MNLDNFSSSFSIPQSKRHNPKTPNSWLTKKVRISDNFDYFVPKPWQKECFLLLKDAKRGFIKAFCGSGKTIAARSIGAYKAKVHNLTQVYCVPRTDIGLDGFGGFCNIELPDVSFGKKKKKKTPKIVKCNTPHNFCKSTQEKIQNLIDIMTNEPEHDSGDNVSGYKQIVCTHQCLVLAEKHLRKKNPELLKKFIENKTFWIDEGHHIKGSETKSERNIRNLLGDFVGFILDNPKTNSEIFIMTATPYRADHGCIVSTEVARDFVSYELDFLDHFKTLGIKDVNMDFEEYIDAEDLFKRIKNRIKKEITNKHFVFIPPTGAKWRKNKSDVYKLLKYIYEAIMEALNVDLETAKSMVLDLVTEKTQKFNDKLLKQEPKNGQNHSSKFVVVVACMKCREGSDWCPADRLHNTSMERSAPLNFQTNGRLFREFPQKNNVKIYNYVPEFKGNKREFISDTVNSILYYMLMEDLFNPIMVDIPYFIPKNKQKNPKTRNRTTLSDHFGLNYFQAQKSLLKSFENHNLNDANANSIIIKVINRYLPDRNKYNKKQINEIKDAWKAFLLRSFSKDLRNKIVDVSYIRKNGFDIIVKKQGMSGNFYTSLLNAKEMERFRKVCKLGDWDQDTIEKKSEYLADFAENILGRKVLQREKLIDCVTKEKIIDESVILKYGINDFEALQIINEEHKKLKAFNDKLNDEAKKTNNFSLQDIASKLKVSEKELRTRISRWTKGWLPINWQDDMVHKSWL